MKNWMKGGKKNAQLKINDFSAPPAYYFFNHMIFFWLILSQEMQQLENFTSAFKSDVKPLCHYSTSKELVLSNYVVLNWGPQL